MNSVIICDGIAVLENGDKVNLLEIQALLIKAFQETGINNLAELAAGLARLTRMEIGPHGEWLEITETL